LLEGASRVGVRWPTICHGNAGCLVCWVQVMAGEENIFPAGPMEIMALEILRAKAEAIGPLQSCVRCWFGLPNSFCRGRNSRATGLNL
jgi:2Fe-2S ferredoxin